MKLEHVAIAFNSEVDSENFFVNFLEFKKVREFSVKPDLNEKFFGINKEQKVIRYENDSVAMEVFITNDKTKSMDLFTHMCIEVQDRDKLVEKAKLMNIKYIKVPREKKGYYLFLKDSFGNLYEIK